MTTAAVTAPAAGAKTKAKGKRAPSVPGVLDGVSFNIAACLEEEGIDLSIALKK